MSDYFQIIFAHIRFPLSATFIVVEKIGINKLEWTKNDKLFFFVLSLLY